MAEFNLGVNVNDKASEVKAKLDAIGSEFPEGLKQPVVEKIKPVARIGYRHCFNWRFAAGFGILCDRCPV